MSVLLALAMTCALGAYQSASGELAAVTPPAPGHTGLRYTLLDGKRGDTTAPDSPLRCEDGKFAGWDRLRFRKTTTTFSSDGTKLYGELLEPTAVEKPPLVVFVHGSERQSPIELYYQLLFTAQGVATFFYDKRGTGRSQGTYTQDFALLADDAANAARTARELAAGRTSRLGFFGGSQGGWVAPLAAQRVNANFLEIGFGCVCTPLEQDQWQVDYQLVNVDGFSPSILRDVHRVTKATADVMGARSPNLAPVTKVKSEFSKAPWFSKIDGQYSGDLLHGNTKDAWLENQQPHVPWHYLGLDVLSRLDIPQLWVFAQDDSVAPSAGSIERLERLNATCDIRSIVEFPHADHGIKTYRVNAAGSRVPGDDLANGYLRLLGDYAKGTVSGQYGDAQWKARASAKRC